MKAPLLLAFSLALASPSLSQTLWFVDASGTAPGTGTAADPFTSIQFAIDQPTTIPGDFIQVAAGTYAESINFAGKDISIAGDTSVSVPIIDPVGPESAVVFESGETSLCSFSNFDVRGGNGRVIGGSTTGGGILVLGASPRIEGITLTGGDSADGGGCAVIGGDPVIIGCTFSDNEAERGGGLFIENATITMFFCEFSDNLADGANGPTSRGVGGGIHVGTGASIALDVCLFVGNRTLDSGRGAGIHVDATSVNTTVLNTPFENNHPGNFNSVGTGGAVYARGPFEASGCNFVGNGGIDDGTTRGGAANGGTYRFCVFEGNRAQFGGAITDATAEQCEFFSNVGCADGGGFGGAAIDSTLENCTLENNWACGRGGGAANSDLINCDVRFNRAIPSENGECSGGGLWNGTASFSRIHGNEALRGTAGSLFAAAGGGTSETALERCIVSSNISDIGGGIVGGTHQNVTVVGNVATMNGGGVSGGFFNSSIIWHNLGGLDASFSTFAFSNVEVQAGGAPAGPGNLAVDPLLAGPGGGMPFLTAGSPCIDTGDPMLPPDPDMSAADMGARPFFNASFFSPANYCRPTRTQTGCLPRISYIGGPSLSGQFPFQVNASDVPPNQFGLMFVGFGADSIPLPLNSFQTGSLCVQGPWVRLPVQLSSAGNGGDCDGTFEQTLSPSFMSSLGLQPGDLLYAQYWFRANMTSVALTDALEIQIRP